MELNISTWTATQYLIKYHSSVRQFWEFYKPLILKPEEEIRPHFIYLCPLCLNEYILYKDDVWSCSTEFTLDHFPPKNIGGTNTILTCKNCNNSAGSSYEPVMEEWLGMLNFNKRIPNTELKTTAKLSDKKGWYHASLGLDETGNLLHDFNAVQLKKFGLDKWGKEDDTMDITLKDPDKKKMTKALLKTAYLYCFNCWGYEFTYSPAGELIRKVLKDEVEYPISITEIHLDAKNTPPFNNLPFGLTYFHSPDEVYGMFVLIPFHHESNGYRTIVPVQIPNPTVNAEEELKVFQTKFKKGTSLDTMVTPVINTLETLMTLPYSLSWIKINKDIREGKYKSA